MKADGTNDYYVYEYDALSERVSEVYEEYIGTPKRDGSQRKDVGFRWFDFRYFKDEDCSRLKTGLDNFRFRDARHTATTRMINAGMNYAEVMKITGHDEMKTFLRYLNITSESARIAPLKLETWEVVRVFTHALENFMRQRVLKL